MQGCFRHCYRASPHTNSVFFSCFSLALFPTQRFSNPCAASHVFLPHEVKVNFIFISIISFLSPRTFQLSPQGGHCSPLSQGCCSISTGGCSDLPGTAPAPEQASAALHRFKAWAERNPRDFYPQVHFRPPTALNDASWRSPCMNQMWE